MLNVLVVDDNASIIEILYETVINFGFSCSTAETAELGLELFKKDQFDIVITDIKLPGMSGVELLKQVKSLNSDTVVILITAFGSIEEAVECMKLGAYDFILKPFKISEIELKIKNISNNLNLKDQKEYLQSEINMMFDYTKIIGHHGSMQQIFDKIKAVADKSTTILITGETGTGKELIARALHFNSCRKDKPFVKVDCSSLSPGVLESELFGHEKGAFTGALKRYKGRFEIADKGTIFLDEIGDVDKSIQVKLLRVLQEKKFERVGSTVSIEVDVRLIAATNRNLEELVKKNKFREDLYYRLNVIPIKVPPLRERKTDIKYLAEHFIKKYSTGPDDKVKTITDEALLFLVKYDWPGNVRELENAIERMVVLSRGKDITVKDVPLELKKSDGIYIDNIDIKIDSITDLRGYIEKIESDIIKKALDNNNWNQTKTAEKLGISRTDLQYKMKKYF